ncbi:MAG TPA: TylF/MycF/NovP-related O-methyltransferase [Sphingomicrobium sp.]|nr:TylF/MycF/NovP-related O-methyltransferase [Sphingomicrobium sp.]
MPNWLSNLAPGRILRTVVAWRGSIVAPLGAGWENELAALRQTRRIVPLLMTDAAALQIQICVRAARQLDGLMAEAGVLMGGSARLICEAKRDVPLHLFDVFETVQSASASPCSPLEQSIRDHFKATHGTADAVRRLLRAYPHVHLHPGVFPASVPPVLRAARFSFVHLDMDLAESTREGLEFFYPRLVPGGMLVGDDYQDVFVRKAFTDYFRPYPETPIELPWGQVLVVKQG